MHACNMVSIVLSDGVLLNISIVFSFVSTFAENECFAFCVLVIAWSDILSSIGLRVFEVFLVINITIFF